MMPAQVTGRLLLRLRLLAGLSAGARGAARRTSRTRRSTTSSSSPATSTCSWPATCARTSATARASRVEFVGGSITSQNFGETNLDAGGGVVIPGQRRATRTRRPRSSTRCAAFNPWIDQADFDHHGYALVSASRTGFDCTLKRVATIKERSHQDAHEQGLHATTCGAARSRSRASTAHRHESPSPSGAARLERHARGGRRRHGGGRAVPARHDASAGARGAQGEPLGSRRAPRSRGSHPPVGVNTEIRIRIC